MWRIIITTLIYMLIVVESRPLEPLEEAPLWPGNAFRSIQTPDDNSIDYEDVAPVFPRRFPSEKRALTMLARWGSFSDLGKNRTPIRSSPRTQQFVQSRTRIEGQPLRWG